MQEELEKLQYDFQTLTLDLKDLDADDPQYGTIWDERADVRRKIRELEEKIKADKDIEIAKDD